MFSIGDTYNIDFNTGYTNGVSWNNMNNPVLYRFPQFLEYDLSAFTIPSRSSLSYIDEMLKPLPGVNISKSSDFASYSMFNDNLPLPCIDNIVSPINFSFGSNTINSSGRNFGMWNNGFGGINNGFNYNNKNNSTPFIPSHNGIYDTNAYQRYLDSVWGSNFASSQASNPMAPQQASNQNGNKPADTQNGNKPSGTDSALPGEQQEQSIKLPESRAIKTYREKVNNNTADETERKIVENFDDRNNFSENAGYYDDILAKLHVAFETNDEECAEEILNDSNLNLGLLEQLYFQNLHRSLREDIASVFPVKGLGWATKRYSPKVQKYLNLLDEKAASTSPFNTAMALNQTLSDGIFGFRVNQDRIRKIIDSEKMQDPKFAYAVDKAYESLTGHSFPGALSAKLCIPEDLKSKVRKKFTFDPSIMYADTDA